jgi:SAM-dependent methyltransferase
MVAHTGASYENIAGNYASTVDAKPWNAFYESPGLTSLLPPLKNASVLDVGCGSGWYAEYLVSQGASVTSFDYNQEFVNLTRARLHGQARVLQADLSQPLAFCSDAAFDLVLCPLVMHYLKDWLPVFKEFHRVLKPHACLAFSTHHPFHDWKAFNIENYFSLELIEDEWKDVGKVSFYRRPLTTISQDLDAAGFYIERLLEPQPTVDFQRALPQEFKLLSTQPWFLFIRACKKD